MCHQMLTVFFSLIINRSTAEQQGYIYPCSRRALGQTEVNSRLVVAPAHSGVRMMPCGEDKVAYIYPKAAPRFHQHVREPLHELCGNILEVSPRIGTYDRMKVKAMDVPRIAYVVDARWSSLCYHTSYHTQTVMIWRLDDC